MFKREKYVLRTLQWFSLEFMYTLKHFSICVIEYSIFLNFKEYPPPEQYTVQLKCRYNTGPEVNGVLGKMEEIFIVFVDKELENYQQ